MAIGARPSKSGQKSTFWIHCMLFFTLYQKVITLEMPPIIFRSHKVFCEEGEMVMKRCQKSTL